MDQTGRMPDVDVHRIFDRVAHLYDTGWLQRALYTAVQDRALAELRACRPALRPRRRLRHRHLRRPTRPGAGPRRRRRLRPVGRDAGRGGGPQPRGWAGCGATRPGCPLRDGVVDAVVCTQAFHFFDQPAAWAEFRRVLTPGGHALVGMIHPRTASGAGRSGRLSSAGSKTRVTCPDRARRCAAWPPPPASR